MASGTGSARGNAEGEPIDVVLVPGYWLGEWAWDAVVPILDGAGLRPHPVTLPGLGVGDDRSGITLEDQVRHVRALLDSLGAPAVLVGHSGGAGVVQGVVDEAPDLVRRAVYVDAGPLVEGRPTRPDLGEDLVEVPLPSWEELEAEGSPATGIDEGTRRRIRDRAVPHPAGVGRSPVRARSEARKQVPVTVICTTLPSEDLRQATGGPPFYTDLPELDVTYVDLPTGHFPMFSRPEDLAAAIIDAARS